MAESAPAQPAPETATSLTRLQKLAALLVILGPYSAAQILRGLTPRVVEDISTEMARFAMIDRELQTEILREFSEVAIQAGTGVQGGVDVTRATLERAIGVFKANEILARVAPFGPSVAAVHEVIDLDPREIYTLIRHEQPQTAALILSYAGADKAAEILMFFQPEQRDKVLERIATLSPTPVEVVEKVVAVLVAKRGVSRVRALSQTGGVKSAADLVNALDKNQGNMLLGVLEERNPDLCKAIRQKMFTFEDLINLDTSMLQRILREVDMRELALALKSTSDKLRAKLLSCITKRAAETVQEEMSFMGAVRLKDTEAAQLRIVDAVRRLEAEGTLDLSEVRKGAKNEMV